VPDGDMILRNRTKMAILRCDLHKPKVRKNKRYIFVADPVTYPDSQFLCGHQGCNGPGRVWLNIVDALMYRDENQRTFRLQAPKRVTVQEGGHFEPELTDQ